MWLRLRERLTAGNLVVLLALVGLLAVTIRRGGDADFFAHITAAQVIVEGRGLPGHDVFSYTVSGRTWIDHEYMNELLLYGLFNFIGGAAAVSVVFGLLIAAGFALMWRRIELQPAPKVVTAAALLLGAAAGVALWGPRAQVVTFTLFSLSLLLIELYVVRGSRAVYFMPLVVAVWANFHAGFVFAFLLLVLAIGCELVVWAVDRERRHILSARTLALVLAGCVVAGLITPWGPSLYNYVWLTQTSGTLANFTAEWQSPDFHHANMVAFGLMIGVFAGGLALRRPRLHHAVVALIMLGLALQAQRNILLFVAAAVPVIAWSYGAWWQEHRVGDRLLYWARLSARDMQLTAAAALVLVAVGVAAFTADSLGKQAASTRANFPVAASDWLAAHPSVGTRMFSDVGWSGYFNYRFYPQANRRVFMLGDPTLAGDTLMRQYTSITTLDGWQSLLDHYGVDYVVFEPDAALAAALNESAQWRRVYQDGVAAIWVRGAGSAQ